MPSENKAAAKSSQEKNLLKCGEHLITFAAVVPSGSPSILTNVCVCVGLLCQFVFVFRFDKQLLEGGGKSLIKLKCRQCRSRLERSPDADADPDSNPYPDPDPDRLPASRNVILQCHLNCIHLAHTLCYANTHTYTHTHR